jgi:hypothetical protein
MIVAKRDLQDMKALVQFVTPNILEDGGPVRASHSKFVFVDVVAMWPASAHRN